MAIYRLLQNSAFEPDQVKTMGQAFEAVCAALGITDSRNDPRAEAVAGAIIALAQQGVTSAEELCARALAQVRPAARRCG